MKGNQIKNKEFGHVGAGAPNDKMDRALKQPEPRSYPTINGGMQSLISCLNAPAIEPMIALPCWIMVPGMDNKTEWLKRELRFLPSQVEQYYQGAIYTDSTCLVMKSGNIVLCELSVESYEEAMRQYCHASASSLNPFQVFKPAL